MAFSFITSLLQKLGFGNPEPEPEPEAAPEMEPEDLDPLDGPEPVEMVEVEDLGLTMEDLPPLELPSATATLPLSLSDEPLDVDEPYGLYTPRELEAEVVRLKAIIEDMQREPVLYDDEGESSASGVMVVRVYNPTGESGGRYDADTDTYSSCTYRYTVGTVDEQTVLATGKTPAKARNASTQYDAAASGSFGLWDPATETLLIAYDETEDTRTDCSV